MALRFVIGRAGSGKTERCLDEIRSELRRDPSGPPLLLLVPEQATFQAEHALVTTPGIAGMIRAQVYSFPRLAWRIMQETGGTSGVPIDATGKTMLVQRLLHKHADRFELFHASADKAGFAGEVLGFFDELKKQCIQAQAFSAHGKRLAPLLEEEPGLLKQKLADLQTLYEDYEAAMAGVYLDTDSYLDHMVRQLPASTLLEGADLWVDGFFGFTPLEMQAILQCARHARSVTVTLCLDRPYEAGDEPDELDLFYPTAAAMARLRSWAQGAGIRSEEVVVLENPTPPRYLSSPMLAHLESQFDHRLSGRTEPYAGSADAPCSLSVNAAANPKAEVDGVARRMLRLAADEGVRWRDMAVMVRDMEGYGERIASVFAEFGIPYFLDKKRSVTHHPLAEFVRSALDVALHHWRYEAVFRCVKTDFFLPLEGEADGVAVGRHQMDELENHVLAYGIQGYRWKDERSWMLQGELALEEEETGQLHRPDPDYVRMIRLCRRLVTGPLERFEESFGRARTVREMAEALYVLLDEVRAPERLERWSDEALGAGQPEKAREHAQMWDRLIDLIDQLDEMLGDDAMEPGRFADLVDAGLDSIRLGHVPPAVDQVLIGSIDRTRSTRIKYCFVLGVNDGVMPAKVNLDGILSENEREFLCEAGMGLADGGRRRQLDEQLLLYSVFCTPSEHLWISYPLADDEGKALLPSEIVRQVRAMFPLLAETMLLAEPSPEQPLSEQMGYVSPTAQAISYLIVQIKQWMKTGEMSPFWWDVYNWFVTRDDWQDKVQMMTRSLQFTNREEPLAPETSRQLYGTRLQASVSRMEKFVACPFSQFASHGLRLKERRVFRLEAPDIGQLFHAALSGLVQSIQHEQADWATLQADELLDRASETVDRLAPRLQGEILLSTPRYRYIARKLKGIVGRATLILAEHACRSGFAPVGLELGFGPDEPLPPLRFELENGCVMEVIGRIDRVDSAVGERGLLLRVVDYKSSSTDLRLPELYYGLSLQMLTYLDVVLTHAEQWLGQPASPAGVLYFHVHNPILGASAPMTPEAADAEMRKRFKMKGLVLADKEAVQLMDTKLDKGYSEIIPVALKADGGFYSNASVATPEQWSQLRSYVRGTIRQIGTELTNGEVGIRPFRMGPKAACTFCSFRPVCQFDPLLEGNQYRVLDRRTKDDVWASLAPAEPSSQTGGLLLPPGVAAGHETEGTEGGSMTADNPTGKEKRRNDGA
ncbi:ATP-dependent helicase/deoxyribonuclease subunit B [Paenibacillus sp. J31TS4]|uniref:helicase-exonuclease AddAB subunit AddB n=1 Tax=Paenibacillus sp. J31TS4 TaxID=2807195 RepID=UPI001B24694E|nr:helicase-exonuclease AddAB subunit AddB [Paenibacillus sp. J31TS4]GIP39595.1 ATP-dependent helicase/deoxyribonuclease subunit B [Paenibacillus sp. J31TS4]